MIIKLSFNDAIKEQIFDAFCTLFNRRSDDPRTRKQFTADMIANYVQDVVRQNEENTRLFVERDRIKADVATQIVIARED